MNTRSTVLGLALAALAACAPVDDAPAPVGAQSIRDGNLATAFQRARVARVSGCTATIIGPRHLLTAARCQARVGDVARFYGGTSTELLAGVSREVDRVTLPSGIVTSTGDYLDSSNDFADLVVLRLSADVPGTSRPATLSWRYPGALANGFKVGAGRHNETANPAGVLLLKDDFTWTASDSGGFFNTHSEDTDAGDGGGPFFRNGGQTSGQVFGVLHGDVSDGFGCGIFPIATCNRYSSVPRHLDFILDAAAYVGPFSTSPERGAGRSATWAPSSRAAPRSAPTPASTPTTAARSPGSPSSSGRARASRRPATSARRARASSPRCRAQSPGCASSPRDRPKGADPCASCLPTSPRAPPPSSSPRRSPRAA
jgi:hypothetical protein